jgi:hypothetical protein
MTLPNDDGLRLFLIRDLGRMARGEVARAGRSAVGDWPQRLLADPPARYNNAELSKL